ncbi:MAG TPA: DUF2125 domain-containing protein [Pseudolabrys sp.]|nr:DUF2125 domain-containing protein [Pseudolabrys sp.]
MVRNPNSLQSRRRTGRRYVILLFVIFALVAGWTWFWKYAAAQAENAVEGWRAREAKAGRIYKCGSQSVGGFPFRIEVNCEPASAEFRSNQPPVELKAGNVVVVAQVYQPNLLISEFQGPLTIADLGQTPKIVANWRLGESSLRGTPSSPERVSLVFDEPAIELVDGGRQTDLLRAKHLELHGRIVEGSAADNPVLQVALYLAQASAPLLGRAAVKPVDAEVVGTLRGLGDLSPKPWHERFRELQQRGGRIDITQARISQGETLATGSGSLSIDPNGRLQGQLSVTVAGLEPFLISIGAQQAVQNSANMDKLAGMLDRLSPGLGDAARQQAGANLSLGINMLGKPATLEGRRAVTLPLIFKDGAAYLGPIPLGSTPALF